MANGGIFHWEKSVETFLAANGIQARAGQLVRLLNIPFIAPTHLHGFENSKDFVDHINDSSFRYFGTLGRAWLEWLIEHKRLVSPVFLQYRKKWQDTLPNDASPQVKRVADRFAILETALQLAKDLTLWTEQENSDALQRCFNEWINIFGFHSKEEQQIIEQVNGWLLRFGSRFIEYPFNPNQPEPKDTAGYKLLVTERNDKERFLVYPQVYLEEIVKGFDEKQASNVLHGAGMLEKSKDTPPRFKTQIPARIDKKRTRCYMLVPLIEEDEQADESNQQSEA